MENKQKINLQRIAVFLFLVLFAVGEFIEISYVKDEFQNRMLSKIIQHAFGIVGVFLLVRSLDIKVFGKIENAWCLLPCFIVALDNFQWSAFFNGKMQLIHTDMRDFILFFLYCMTVGLLEELLFRGILFGLLAGFFSKDRKGFLITYTLSSVLFGVAHLFNGFSIGTLLQVGYTVLTGGLFAFCFVKTKNILCPAFIHGIYNFCGLLYDKQGLGMGVVFDMGTVLTMVIVSVLVGVFVLYEIWKYPEREREALYKKFDKIL